MGFVDAIVTTIKKDWAGISAPIYAIFEGLVLGSIAKLSDMGYYRIIFQVMALTSGVTFGMLILYKTDVIKVTCRLQMIVGSALFGITMFYLLCSMFYLLSSMFYLLSSMFYLLCSIFYLLSSISYVLSWILSFFGVNALLIYSSDIFGIVFNVFVVTVAVFCLGMDFDFIVKVSNRGLPSYMS
jgi:uncharacterized YccA/Bax inhibitor family protein